MKSINWTDNAFELIKSGKINYLDIIREKEADKRVFLNNLRMINSNSIKSQNKINTFFESYNHPVLLVNDLGVIIKSNHAFYNTFNYKKSEVQQQFFAYLFQKEKFMSLFSEIQWNKMVKNFDNTPVEDLNKKGRQNLFYWTSIPCQSYPFFIVVGQTESKRLSTKEKQAYIEHFLNLSLITSLDKDNNIIDLSKCKIDNFDFKNFHKVGLNIEKKEKVSIYNDAFEQFMEAVQSNQYFNGIIHLKFNGFSDFWLDRTFIVHYSQNGETKKYLIDSDVSLQVMPNYKINVDAYSLKKRLLSLNRAVDRFAIVAITDQKGTIKYVNDNFCKISKYSHEELIGNNHRILKSDEHNTEFFKKMFSFISRGRLWRGEVKNIAKDGTAYWVNTVIVPVLNNKGKPVEYVSIRHDITDKKNIEQQLEKSLEAEHKASMARQLLFSKLSHELRTPLNAIIGYTDLMLEDNQNPAQTEYLNTVKDAGESLVILINEILDFTQLESKKIQLDRVPFDLNLLVSSTVRILTNEAQQKNLRIVIQKKSPKEIYVNADPLRIRQILMNLISNAIKFTKEGKITIKYEISKELEDSYIINFDVIDTGIGIAKKNQERIFDVFKQEHEGISRKFGGSGLGLSIVKSLVEMYQGSISLKSELGEGSSFQFDLKLNKASREDLIQKEVKQETDYQKYTLDGLRVLVIEDNIVNQELIRNRLEKWNCEVDITDNGHLALEWLKEKKHQIILMDLQMPNITGYDLTKLFRSQKEEWIKNIPIIAQTAEARGSNLISSINKAGMNAYLSKPCNPQALFNILVDFTNVKKVRVKHAQNKNTSQNNSTNTSSRNKLINLEFFIRETDGDREMIASSIENFIDFINEYVVQVDLGIKNQDWDLIHKASHKIKPSIQLFGLEEFYKTNQLIVEASRDKKNTREIQNWHNKQKKQFPQILRELKQELKQYSHE